MAEQEQEGQAARPGPRRPPSRLTYGDEAQGATMETERPALPLSRRTGPPMSAQPHSTIQPEHETPGAVGAVGPEMPEAPADVPQREVSEETPEGAPDTQATEGFDRISQYIQRCAVLTAEVTQLRTELRHAQDQLKKAHGERLYAALNPKPAGGLMADEDAARLIFAKCPQETIERFALVREMAPSGYTDCDSIASLLTMLCNTNEQHTGHWEEIRPGRVVMPVGQQAGAAYPGAMPTATVGFGREPRPCESCNTVFTPTKQGERYGCYACGEYPNYLRRVEIDRKEYNPQRVPLGFERWCLGQSIQCECGTGTQGAQARPVVLKSPAARQPLPVTRPRVVTDAQGRQLVIDEPVEVTGE